MRTAFIKTLIAEAEIDDKIFLLCGDLGFSVLDPFAAKFPDRFLNIGIAEQNMVGIAAGLAFEGYTVFLYSIGNFPTLRAMEHIRYDICYHKANVKIIAVGGGYSYGPLGVSHHCTEELGMLRIIPELSVCAPGDPVETELVTRMVARRAGPCYIRLGKAGEPIVHTDNPKVTWGEIIPIIDGSETLVIATGSMLSYANKYIKENGVPWALWSAPFVKPIDRGMIKTAAHKFATIITMEEHQANGGFGTAVLEVLSDLRELGEIAAIPHIKRIAINDIFIKVAGDQNYLRELAGLRLD